MRYFCVGALGRWLDRARPLTSLLVLLTLVLITGGGALALNSVRSVAAEGAVVVRADAPASVQGGTQFDIDVIVEEVADLAGVDLTLTYDPALLTFVEAVPNAALAGCLNDHNTPAAGTLELGLLCATGTDGTPLSLWTVTFDSVAVATITETNIGITRVDLADDTLVELPSSLVGDTVSLTPTADLSITKTASIEPAGLGGKFTYSITVTNHGPAEATNVVVTDVLPNHVVYQGAPGNCSHNSGTITCFIDSLTSGTSESLVIEVQVVPFAEGVQTNTVSVTSDQDDPNPANDTATVDTTLHSAVTVRVSAPDVVAPGDTIDVLVQADNAQNIGGAQLDLLYDATRFSLTATQSDAEFAGCFPGASEQVRGRVTAVLACTDGRSGTPLGFWTFTFHVETVAPSGDTSFSLDGIVLGDAQLPPQSIPSVAIDAQVRVSRTTDLSIAKTDSRDPVVGGTSMTYTIAVTNNGPEDAYGIVVTDQLPPQVTFDSATLGCLYEGPSHSVTCNVGDLANGTSADVTIDVTVQPGTVGTITNGASVTSFEIDPNGANDTVTEDTVVIAPPTLTGTASVSVDEGGDGASTIVDIGVSLSNSIDLPVDVRFDTSDGTATSSDSDYTPVVDGLLTIPAGSTDGTLQVEVVGDVRWEHDEIFSVVITSAEIQGTSVSLNILDGTTTVTARNDDDPPALSVQGTASLAERGPGETATIDLDVSLSGLSGLPITVQYDTADGTATVANGDYVPAIGGSLTIPPDTLSGTVQVDVVGDDRYELDESFSVVLSNPLVQGNGAQPTIAGAASTVTILNDDPLPTLSFVGSASVVEGGAGTTATAEITISLSKPLDVDVTVTYGTVGLTATPVEDYILEVGVTSIPSGETTGTATFTINGDDVIEGDETFAVGLIDGSSSYGLIPIGSPASTTITILDDDSPIVAESSLLPVLDGDGVAVVEVLVERFKFRGGDLSFELSGGILSFDATLAFDAGLVDILDVREVTEFQGDTTFDSTSTPGQLTISGSTAAPVTTTPLVLAKIVVRLIGSNASSTQLTLTGLQLTGGGTGTVYSQEFQASNTYQRGDVRADGQVRATDRLFLTQCILQLRATGSGAGDCNAINAASVLHDGVNGDIIDESDGLYISQFVIELRDVFFNLIN